MSFGSKGEKMRRRQVITALLFLLSGILILPCSISAQTAEQEQYQQVIDLTILKVEELILEDETLQSALFKIIAGTDLNHIIPRFGTEQDSIQISSLHVRDMSVADALREVLEPLGLTYRQEGNFLRILPNREARVIYFKYLASRFAQTASGVGTPGTGGMPGGAAQTGQVGTTGTGGMMGIQQFETQLKEWLSEDAFLRVDVSSHTIYVEDLIPNVERLAEYIELIDIPPRQVEIQVVLVEIVHSEDTGTGVDYRLGLTGSDVMESAVAELPGLSQTGFLMDLTGIGLGGLYGGQLKLDAALRALVTISDADVLSKPSTVVLDGRPAIANLSDQIPYTEAVFGQGYTAATTQFKEIGIILRVTPTILDSSTVQIQLSAEFSSVATLSAEGVPSISSTSANSQVVVGDGDVLVVGGLFRESETLTRTGVPILSKIPILKYLFSSNQMKKEKRELVIFISPRIIHTGPSPEMPPGIEP